MIKHKGNVQDAFNKLKQVPNAIAHFYDNAELTQSGIMSGATYTLKTNFATKTTPSSASSLILENFVAGYDATVVNKFNKAGATLIAKTHADELGLGGTGLDSAFGKITNPLNKDHMVGGSSSGAAATMVDGVSIAIGSDTGDSVRTPASYVGKVGFKPSYGAISRYGLFAFASSLDTAGFLTHNVNDAIIAAQGSYGHDENDLTSRDIKLPELTATKPKKVAILRNLIKTFDKEYQDQFNDYIKTLKVDGIEIVEKDINLDLINLIPIVYQIISFSEASSNLANLDGINFGPRLDGKSYSEIMTNTRSHKFGQTLQRRLTLGAYFLSVEHQEDIFQRAQKVRRLIVNEFTKIYDECDFILSVASSIAPLISKGKIDDTLSNYLIHSNFEGSPSIVIPFGGKKDDMPFGIALDSKQDSDAELLSAALYLEEAMGVKND